MKFFDVDLEPKKDIACYQGKVHAFLVTSIPSMLLQLQP